MSAPEPVDVAVVGCGPVGATLAVLLAQRGRSVAVLERQRSPYPLPRAVHMDDHVARILQAAGLGEDLPGITEAAPVYEWRGATGATLLRIGRPGDGPSGWPTSAMFTQPALEALLRDRAVRLGVELRTGTEVTGLEAHADGVALQVAAGPDVAARWVVGADGAGSAVRQAAGLELVDLGVQSDWLIVDVVPDHPGPWEPTNLQVCDPARPTTAVSGGPGRRRWEFMRLPGEPLEALGTVERAWELLAPWDVHPGNATIERRAIYTFGARHAARWRAGRVLIAGDAAHQMPPFAGQGMCAGIRDAANLAWKLDAVLAGHDDRLLDTYEVERRADVAASIAFSVELGGIICVLDPAEAAERDRAMAAVAAGGEPTEAPGVPPITEGVLATSPQAGQLWPQGRTTAGRSDDVQGAWWRLVTTGAPPRLDAEVARWWAALGGRTVVADPADDVATRWFAEHGCGSALVRPDFHVFGTAAEGAAARLVGTLRERLGPPHPG